MSRGHVTATHHRSVYADPQNCGVCYRELEERIQLRDELRAEEAAKRAAELEEWRRVDRLARQAAREARLAERQATRQARRGWTRRQHLRAGLTSESMRSKILTLAVLLYFPGLWFGVRWLAEHVI